MSFVDHQAHCSYSYMFTCTMHFHTLDQWNLPGYILHKPVRQPSLASSLVPANHNKNNRLQDS